MAYRGRAARERLGLAVLRQSRDRERTSRAIIFNPQKGGGNQNALVHEEIILQPLCRSQKLQI